MAKVTFTRADKLTGKERRRLLAVVDRIMKAPPLAAVILADTSTFRDIPGLRLYTSSP